MARQRYLEAIARAPRWLVSSRCLAGVLLLFWATHAGAGGSDYSEVIKPLLARECVRCHGASTQKGNLRLDTASTGLKGGDNGPAWVPGNTAKSLILQVVQGLHPSLPTMPYKRPALTAGQIASIRDWIQAGASHPSDEPASSDQHWAFLPPQKQSPPSTPQDRHPNPIDRFIRREQSALRLLPSPEASPATLIRRMFLDVIGLPPTEMELNRFLGDPAEGRWERLADYLLGSPHYGERWARWWLDGARYADSNGYSIDSPRSIWPYRDWVLNALNSDMPFTQFTLWQIAGDLLPPEALPPGTPRNDPLVASGFHRNTQVNHEGGVDPEQFRVESVVDRVNTTATVWLGLTLACAQCHDHKFDPVSQRDYYRFMAFFNSTENDGHGNSALEAEHFVELSAPEDLAKRDALRVEWQKLEKDLDRWIREELDPQLPKWEANLSKERLSKFGPVTQEVLQIPAAQRTLDQSNFVHAVHRNQDPERQRRQKDIATLKSKAPRIVTSLVMKELPKPRETRVLIKGDFTRPSDVVNPGVPAVLPPLNEFETSSLTNGHSHPTRFHLAKWLTSAANPLTARVTVNRIWQQIFGRGLVETENDFGIQGSPPTHPALLDWLAVDFMENGWSLKKLIRQILTTQTYRQSSHTTPTMMEVDPANKWLARQSRLRLEAELIRDSFLRASDLLNPALGGAPVFPPQPEGLGSFTQNDRPWRASPGEDRYRRALYTHLQRTTLHPALAVFDAPEGGQSCTRRNRSNTPLQALTLLNDPAYTEMAFALSQRLRSFDPHASDEKRIAAGYRWCTSRLPTSQEVERLLVLIREERQAMPDNEDAVWMTVARVLMNLDESQTRE